jgi:nucleoside-diphosphate-sugar epimerase
MKVFVTGATGYIGSHVARAFRRAGHDVSGLVRTVEKSRALAAEEVRPVFGTLQELESWRAAAAEAAIVVLAAADYQADALAVDKKTVDACLRLAAEGARPKTLLYTSGVWVHGDTGGAWVDETTPLDPAKLVARRPEIEERVLEADGVHGVVLRPGCVYGRQGGLTGNWFAGAVAGEVRMVGEGGNRWAMVHAEDLAHAYVLAAESGASGEVFDLADASSATVREMAEAAAAAAGGGVPVRAVPLDQARQKLGDFADCLALDQRIDAGKAHRLLGWAPRHRGFVAGVAVHYAAWKAHQPA